MVLSWIVRTALGLTVIGTLTGCTPVGATVSGTKAAAKVATAPVRAVF